jgi:hypothetical protein
MGRAGDCGEVCRFIDLEQFPAGVDAVGNDRRGRFVAVDELQRCPGIAVDLVGDGQRAIGGLMRGFRFTHVAPVHLLALAQFGEIASGCQNTPSGAGASVRWKMQMKKAVGMVQRCIDCFLFRFWLVLTKRICRFALVAPFAPYTLTPAAAALPAHRADAATILKMASRRGCPMASRPRSIRTAGGTEKSGG